MNNQSLISNSIISTRKQSWQSFQTECANRLAMYKGDFLDLIKTFIRNKLDKDAWEQVYSKRYYFSNTINIMLDMITKTAKLYNNTPNRQYIIGSEISKEFDELYNNNIKAINSVLDQSLRYSMVSGGCLIRISYSDRFIFTVLTPDMFTPVVDKLETKKLVGVSYSITNYMDQLNYERSDYYFNISDLTKPIYKEVSGKTNIELSGENYPWRDENGNPFLPLVTARVFNDESEYINQYVGYDLYNATLLANWYETQKEWLIRHQSHKQPVIIGSNVDKIGKAVLDPTIPIFISNADKNEVSVEFKDISVDVSQFDRSIDKIYEREASKRGYSVNDFVQTAERQTAEAIRINNKQRDEYIQTLCKEFASVEDDFAYVMIKMNNLVDGNRISESGNFYIQYKRENDLDFITMIAYYRQMYDLGLLSKADLLMIYDSNITSISEAEVLIKNNLIKLNLETGIENENSSNG